jgi:uncharacterized SAM-binding protein YcdF (DUF218 family)
MPIYLFLFLLLLINPFTQVWIASQYVVDDVLEPSDAVVALRGGEEEQRLRVEEARNLVNKRYAPVLMASVSAKPFWGHSQRQFIEDYLKRENFPAQRIRACENTADSTAEEALALRACLQNIGARQVIIVTSEYHTRRARFIFRNAFSGSGIVPIIHPVYNSDYWDKHWWRRRRWAKTFLDETMKLVWSFIEQWIPQKEPEPGPAEPWIKRTGPPMTSLHHLRPFAPEQKRNLIGEGTGL